MWAGCQARLHDFILKHTEIHYYSLLAMKFSKTKKIKNHFAPAHGSYLLAAYIAWYLLLRILPGTTVWHLIFKVKVFVPPIPPNVILTTKRNLSLYIHSLIHITITSCILNVPPAWEQFLITNSGFWLVNILLRKFDTIHQKKRNENDKNTTLWWKTRKKCLNSVCKHKVEFFILNSPHRLVM